MDKQIGKLGFRPARITEATKQEINKQESTRLNMDISKKTLQKLKMFCIQNNTTIRDVVTRAIEGIIK